MFRFRPFSVVEPHATTASTPVVESKMATFTDVEQAQCVLWFQEMKSATQVQRNFHTQYAKIPPSRSSVYD